MDKKSYYNRFLIVMIVFLAGNLFMGIHTSINAKPMAIYAGSKKAVPIECTNGQGEVIAYGADCNTGKNSCVPNDCPM